MERTKFKNLAVDVNDPSDGLLIISGSVINSLLPDPDKYDLCILYFFYCMCIKCNIPTSDDNIAINLNWTLAKVRRLKGKLHDYGHIYTRVLLYNNNSRKRDISKNKRKNIIPPNIEWIKEYCKERNNDIDPVTFYQFYDGKGWKIGKTKMVNWQAAIMTWERNRIKVKTKPPIYDDGIRYVWDSKKERYVHGVTGATYIP